MKYVGIVFRKEIYRVFSDKKMIFSLFILPVIMMFAVYGLIGVLASSMLKDQAEHEPTLLICTPSKSFIKFLDEKRTADGDTVYTIGDSTYHVSVIEDKEELEDYKKQVLEGELDVILEFPEDFDAMVADYDAYGRIPDVYTFCNPSEDYSSNAKVQITALLEDYRKLLQKERYGSLESLQIFSTDATNEESEIQNDNKARGKLLGMVVPYLVTVLLFASVMSLGTDTFTGEKERGTMAALLMAPIPRSAIVYGKLFGLMLLTGISALVYGGAVIFAMPIMYRAVGALTGENLSFTAGQMAMMLTLIVTLVFVYVTLIAVAGTFASKMQESSNYIMPIYMAVMAVGMMTIFQGDKIKLFQYLIPLYGPSLALKNVFTLDITLPGFFLAVLSNIMVGVGLAFLTEKMFKNERIMFNA